MIPLRDNIPSGTRPVVNYALIAVTLLMFLFQLGQAPDDPSIVEQFGMIPARVQDPDGTIVVKDERIVETARGYELVQYERPAAPTPIPAWLTVLTCIFLHGGWLHFLGNMWFLWIFGDNVEDRFGHFGFLAFYLGAGVLASLTHLVTNLGSTVPTVGASGAIAGVMGAYLLLYPHALVVTLIPIFFFLHVVVLPASLFLGLWFLLQLLQGTMSIGNVRAGGVAWWAHIGGFAVGFAVAWLLGRLHRLRPAVTERRSNADCVHHYTIRRRPRGY